MSITKSIQFYGGKKCVPTQGFFGGIFMDYQFCLDIAYKDITFSEASKQLRDFMEKNNVKVAYCDISADFGGGYSLIKRYCFINKKGSIITKKESYSF